MKKFIPIFLLLVSVFPIVAQNGAAISSDIKAHLNPVDPLMNQQLKSNLLGRNNSRTVKNVMVDYDLCDEVASTDSGGVQQAFRWDLNTRYKVDSTNNYNIKWAAVTFDTLVDATTCADNLPYGLAPITVDSISIVYLHDNVSSTNDSIVISLRDYRGALGVLVNSSNNLTNARLWSDTTVTDSTLASINGSQWGILTVKPNYTLNVGDKFAVSVEYYGDTADHFGIYAGYKDLCGDQCGAEPSIFENNSFVNLILFNGSNNLSGLPQAVGLFIDCDGSGGPTPLGCEEFYVQNLGIIAYVHADVPFKALGRTTVDSICPGELAPLSVDFVGESDPGNVQIEWYDENNNVVNTGPSYDAFVDSTTTFTVIVTDIGIAADTLDVKVITRGITVNAGADQSISCGAKANLLGTYTYQPGGQLNATFRWSSLNGGNGPTSLSYNNVGPDTYTLTGQNRYGCTSSDQVIVSLGSTAQSVSFISDAANGKACKDSLVTFTNQSTVMSGWTWKWTFSDDPGNYSSLQNATHTFTTVTAPGQRDTVTLTADSASCSLKYQQVYQVQVCSNVGIGSISKLDKLINIYPNPTDGVLNIDFSGIKSQKGSLSIFDVHGKKVYDDALEVAGDLKRVVDLSKYSEGVYLIKIQLGNETLTKKLQLNR